jgi:hypothetical protein
MVEKINPVIFVLVADQAIADKVRWQTFVPPLASPIQTVLPAADNDRIADHSQRSFFL